MTLRSHQAATQAIAAEILAGRKTDTVILAVTPGGGKSAVPVILASLLIPAVADKLVWVAPRNSLKYQGEDEFTDPRWDTQIRLRATDGNDDDPDRGTSGYLTTYQAIGMSPWAHQDYLAENRTILFLDEPHHVAKGGPWARALGPMIRSAVLVVYASGTFSRADGQPILGMSYRPDGLVDLTERPGTRVVRYGRRQAIADGAIIAPQLITIDGAASWVAKEGDRRSVESLASAGDNRSDAVFTALRTEYAFALLSACMAHWSDHLSVYPGAKLLVVAPDIDTAKSYHARLAGLTLAEIATSDDGPAARRAIAAFKRGAVRALVTVGMAYEGLSVPEVTHIACLTGIRSAPWLEQMSARGNRLAPGKDGAWVFAPADKALIEAWKMIETEALIPLSDGSGREEEQGGGEGGGHGPSVQPLWSAAHGFVDELRPVRNLTPSQVESELRTQIRAIRAQVVDGGRAGSRAALAKIWSRTVRSVVDKDLEAMSGAELEAVWMKVREQFRGRW